MKAARFLRLMGFGLFTVVFAIMTLSCGKQDNPEKKSGEFLGITNEIIENYDSSGTEKEFVTYEYEKEGDIFWKKAIYKDSENKAVKTIEREFNEKRLPVKEITSEFGSVSETLLVNYSPDFYELLSKEVYDGDLKEAKKTRSYVFNYDKDGCLLSQEVTVYGKDSGFVNADGNNIVRKYKLHYFPLPVNRPPGDFQQLPFFVEYMKQYSDGKSLMENDKEAKKSKIGELIIDEETKFSEDGLPVYFRTNKSEESGLPEEEWYSSDKDGIGNVTQITAYANSSLDNNNENNMSYIFEYDDSGMITRYIRYMYNTKTGKFDLLHNLMEYKWVNPSVTGIHNYTDASLRTEFKCYHKKHFSTTNRQIEKYDRNEKIILESAYSCPLEKAGEKYELKPTKKTTQNFKLISGK